MTTDKKCLKCDHLYDGTFCLDCLLRQLAAAQAIIDRLPKTTDGVPVVPPMKLWFRWGCDYRGKIASATCMIIDLFGGNWLARNWSATGGMCADINKCYSTEAAAEAAARAAAGGKPT